MVKGAAGEAAVAPGEMALAAAVVGQRPLVRRAGPTEAAAVAARLVQVGQ